MTVELLALLGLTGILFLSIMAQALALDVQAGIGHTLSPRDAPHPTPTPLTGRLDRNVANQVEGLLLFAPLVVVASATATSNEWTQGAAVLYLAMRALYVPSYLFAWVPFRSLFWGIGLLALGAFVWGLLGA